MAPRPAPFLARWLARLLAALWLGALLPAAHAGSGAGAASGMLCPRPPRQSAAAQAAVLELAAAVRHTLQASGQGVALISRSGIDLRRFGLRYSHGGIALRRADSAAPEQENPPPAWAVRQLYYDCEQGRPRLFDQGLAAFLLAADASAGPLHVALVLLPPEQAAPVQAAASQRPLALRLLAARYSANAYPFSPRYQNCNQWVAELLASAWGRLPDGPDLRQRAQSWLRAHGYAPAPVAIGSHWLKFAASFVPLLHLDDHPDDARYGMALQTSLPHTVEALARQQAPQARRIEFCVDHEKIVRHEGWPATAPLPADTPATPDAPDAPATCPTPPGAQITALP